MITAKNEVNSMKQSNFNLYVIADALDHFRLMDDPYEYHDCEGVESIEEA